MITGMRKYVGNSFNFGRYKERIYYGNPLNSFYSRNILKHVLIKKSRERVLI